MTRTRPRRRLAAGALFWAVLSFAALPAAGQSLGDAVGQAAKPVPADTLRAAASPAPWPVVAGQVVLGTALSAAGGFGVGSLAETFCDDCDGGEPGGDAAGMVLGVPLGAVLGTWAMGRLAPPSGRLADTVYGALAGTAVFAGYAQILEGQSDGMRWAGVVFPAALAAMGWNRSRPLLEPQVAIHRSLDPGAPVVTAQIAVFRLDF